jgi:hypothetical protein
VADFTSRPFYLREKSWFPRKRGLGGPPEPVWTFCRREKFLALASIRTPDRPNRILLTILTTTKIVKNTWSQLQTNGQTGLNIVPHEEIYETLLFIHLGEYAITAYFRHFYEAP